MAKEEPSSKVETVKLEIRESNLALDFGRMLAEATANNPPIVKPILRKARKAFEEALAEIHEQARHAQTKQTLSAVNEAWKEEPVKDDDIPF